ncbi:MAG: hypothetical protein DRP66_02530 [Planctomycetota bacterium]|nr:MAG: hypothetical protein DRP66_02530 [Planctomycetota bacterium]
MPAGQKEIVMTIINETLAVSTQRRCEMVDITRQAIYFCEFDGPGNRKVAVQVRGSQGIAT